MYFNIDTRDMITDIASELMRSRQLPVDVDSIGVEDPMVLWLAVKRQAEFKEDGSDAILSAKHIYEERIKESNRDAIVLAMTAYTEILGQYDTAGDVVEPEPYEEGQKLFTANKPQSSFVKMMQKRSGDVPEIARNLKNPYEARIKWLDDILNKVGFEFYSKAVTAINTAVMQILKGLPETDDDGFRPESVSEPVAVHTDADSEGKSS